MNEMPPPPPTPGEKNRTIFFVLFGVVGVTLLSLFIFGGLQVLKTMQAKRQLASQARTELDALRASTAERTRSVIQGEDGVLGSSDLLEENRKKIGSIAEKLPPGEKLIVEAGQEVLKEMQPALKNYETAYRAILAVNSFSPVGIRSIADIGVRREKILAFAAANEQLTTTFAAMGGRLRAVLLERGVSTVSTDAAIRGFMENSHANLVAMIREDDRQLGLRMLEVLDLYEKSWGQWEFSEGGELRFEKDADLEHYNRLVEAIQALAKHQGETQQKMLARQAIKP